jgi:hypothetical protein
MAVDAGGNPTIAGLTVALPDELSLLEEMSDGYPAGQDRVLHRSDVLDLIGLVRERGGTRSS